jgi:hypothetical protein
VPEAEVAAAPSARQGLRARAVLTGLGLLFVLVLGVFGYGYWRMVHYERRAAAHLPEQAVLVVRLDLEQVVLFEPFRRYVIGAAKRRVPEPTVWTQLEERTGVRFAMDLREVMFAHGGQPGQWILAIAGLFPDAGVVAGAQQWLLEQGHQACRLEGEALLCASPALAVLQAADGTVLIGSDLQTVSAASKPSEQWRRLGLEPKTTALEIALDATQLGSKPANLGGVPLAAQQLGQVSLLNGRALLGSESRLEVLITPAPGVNVEQVAASARALLQLAQVGLALSGPEVAGERTLLATAQVTLSDDGKRVLVSSPWARADIDRAAQALGDALWAWSNAASAPAGASGQPAGISP